MSAGRILLAEDVEANVVLFRVVLEGAGYEVAVAGDGATAAAEGSSGRFDLILMDLGLPELSGLEAAARIRAAAPTPILALTAEDGPEMERACAASGMTGFVKKPIGPAALIQTVAAHLRG